MHDGQSINGGKLGILSHHIYNQRSLNNTFNLGCVISANI